MIYLDHLAYYSSDLVLDHFSKFQTHPNKIEGSTLLVTVKEKVQWAVKIALKVKTLLCYIGSGLFVKKFLFLMVLWSWLLKSPYLSMIHTGKRNRFYYLMVTLFVCSSAVKIDSLHKHYQDFKNLLVSFVVHQFFSYIIYWMLGMC